MALQTESNCAGSLPPALVYFAKVPRPGEVKTRLCPPLTPQEAAALYATFLDRIVRPHPGVACYLYGAPAERLDELRRFAPAGVELRPQLGEGLFERLEHCVADLFQHGHAAVIVRNTDSPDMPDERIDEALAAIGAGKVALGPDLGGGYYLVGLPHPCPGLFAGLGDVASRDSLAMTVARAEALGCDVQTLTCERDVDVFEDLVSMWRARIQPPA